MTVNDGGKKDEYAAGYVDRKQLAEKVLPDALTRRLRVSRFRRERHRFPERTVTHRYAGIERRVVIASPYGERYDRDWPELGEIAELKRSRLVPGARVLNLGASYAVVAMMLADAVGPGGQVVALEAHPDDARTAQRNQELNDVRQLSVLHAAVAGESGVIPFGVNGSVDDASRSFGGLSVPAFSIDDLAVRYGPPDVVFIDVEGYELEALRGARATLERPADWFVEVHEPEALARYGASREEVIAAFDPERFRLLVAADSLVILPDGRLQSQTAFRPLAEADPSLFETRFFLLALAA